MRNLLEKGAKWLAGVHRKNASNWIIYKRGTSSIEVPAQRTRIITEVETTDGLYLGHEQWTFLIAVADLRLDDQDTIPQAGDRIVQGTDGSGPVYEVSCLPGQTVSNWSDSYQTRYKIFTKLVAN